MCRTSEVTYGGWSLVNHHHAKRGGHLAGLTLLNGREHMNMDPCYSALWSLLPVTRIIKIIQDCSDIFD